MSKDTRDYEEDFKKYWEDIIMNDDGTVNLDQVKRELSDYAFMLEEVPKVYMEVTGGMMSKTNYYASSVISVYREHMEDIIQEEIKDYKEEHDDG